MKKNLPVALTLVIAIIIAITTLDPSDDGPPLPISDKILHAIAFGSLALPLIWQKLRNAIWMAPVALAYGGAIEIIQPHFGRSAEWADLFADATGILVAILLAWLWHRQKT